MKIFNYMWRRFKGNLMQQPTRGKKITWLEGRLGLQTSPSRFLQSGTKT